ncbi:MAG TPA: DUF4203 domain-containing protein [Chthoniobacterales bacterium]|jgi:hypothetical protein
MNPHAVPALSILIGAIVLLFGRKLFWLFVAAIGFWIGFQFTPHLLHHPPAWLTLAVAVGLGILGAVLALVLQKIAIAIAGFLVGGHVASAVMSTFVVTHAQYAGIAFLIGGIIGAILMLALFDWALILFSAIAGAQLITDNLHVPAKGVALIFLGLVILGIIVQAAMFSGRRRTVA